jgi:predicted alpha/beta superfamily hydrolase
MDRGFEMAGNLQSSKLPILSAVAAMALVASQAMAQTPTSAPAEAPAPANAPGYVLPDTQTWELKSAEDYPYQIFVSVPKVAPPAEGYQVLYVLDGNAMFAGFAEARRIQEYMTSPIGKTIIVGIGYQTDQAYDTTRRLYDFTQDFKKPLKPAQQKLKAGGRDQFAAFILNRLRPEIARRYKVNPERQSLYGHSLGGLFSLYMLFNHPTEFHAIIAASPSTWWNDQGILLEERAFAAKLIEGKLPATPSRIRIVAGDLEETSANVTDSQAMAKRLELLSGYGLRSEFELFKGETHITVPSRSVTSTLRFASTWP